MRKPEVCIVSPALADANNGNWQTAWRWSRMLAPSYRSRIVRQWQGEPCDALLALHARRSAASVQAWAAARPGRGLGLVLTGTDLYRDIREDASAQRSLTLAQQLVVLQERGPDELDAGLHARCRVIFQSAPARRTLDKTGRHLRSLMVGHLRDEKSPDTYLAAAELLAGSPALRLDLIGGALDPALGARAQAVAARCAQFRWLGALPREATRRHIQRAHLLVIPSRMEGGAHVVIEAVTSGTPVLASRVAGNVGMLGTGYQGYFEWGDAAGLAGLLTRCQQDPAFLARLRAQCQARAPLFEPARERAALRALVADLLQPRGA